MRVFLQELAILNLTTVVDPEDPEYMSTEEAWQILRECPVDFGTDLAKWAEWVDLKYTSLRRKAIDAQEN